MRRTALIFSITVVFANLTGAAWAQQWPASALALRTNGGFVKSGDCVRLSLVATADVPGPLKPTVSYAFSEAVTVEDKDGKSRTEIRRTVVERPAGTVIERLTAGAIVILDDTFCVGQSSVPGAYDIGVGLSSYGLPASRLSSCVEYHADDTPPGNGCGLALRGVLRRDAGDSVSLDAPGSGTGLYRLLLFRGDSLLRVIEDGIAATGPGELSVAMSAFGGLGSAPVDVVLHDQVGNRSASAARFVLLR